MSASASGHGFAHSRTASAAPASRRSRSHWAARTSTSARFSAGVAAHSRAPRCAAASAASTSACVAFAAVATTRSGLPGSVDTSSSPSRRSRPIHTGTFTGGFASCSASASASRARTGARRSSRIGSLAKGFKPQPLAAAVPAPGGASSSSIAVPRACSWRNESLEVFSSRRRTR